MKALNISLAAAAILGLCAFGACKKNDAQAPAPQPQATAVSESQLQADQAPAAQASTVAIEEYIPADAIIAFLSTPNTELTSLPLLSMVNVDEIKSDGVAQIGMFMRPDYTVAIATFTTTDKVQSIISKNAAKPESQTRTAGSGDRQWTICKSPQADDNTPATYRAFHAEGNTLFVVIASTIDDKTLDTLLDKPTARHPISQIKQQKNAVILAEIDNLALLQNPGTLASFKVSQESFSNFIKEQNITAEFIRNFPTTKFTLLSDDTLMSMEFMITLADPANAAKLMSLRIPGPDLPKDPTVAAAHISLDMLKAYDWATEIANSVQVSTLPGILQQPVQKLQAFSGDEDTSKVTRELISRYGALSFEVYKFAQNSEYVFDLEGRNLTENLEGDPNAKDISVTPITIVNTALMGFMMSVTHKLPDKAIKADIINAITLTSPDGESEGDKFYAGANKDRIVIANTEADVKQLLDNKPQFSERTDLIEVEVSEQTILRTNPFFSKSPKPISKIAIGIGASDNDIKIHLDMVY